jgi:hypothetical protein
MLKKGFKGGSGGYFGKRKSELYNKSSEKK